MPELYAQPGLRPVAVSTVGTERMRLTGVRVVFLDDSQRVVAEVERVGDGDRKSPARLT